MAAVIVDPARPKADVAADALRDPADTLVFAGLIPACLLPELSPGGAYFILHHEANPGTTLEQIS